MTTLRSFLMFYLPLLEPATNVEEDDEDFLQDTPKELHVDLVVPFKKSVKQIIRETTVVTTRRVLERLAVIYVSQRMAWKLLKDEKITEMVLFPTINEACRVLDEGVVARASALDVASVLGMSFPSYCFGCSGGIMFRADTVGSKHIYLSLKKWSERYGSYFKPSNAIFSGCLCVVK
ncbi:uncharacterized protein [Gossypium hirsutum]|uniref:Uncharacterized protein isoform X4 n=1 Tax=Gossypium hirsutum TaxID=3635 RepID=A0ABM3BD07_GOSHI|nr:uncharacterized protein LOC107920584 isoform X4 [Gossypium hirsutum]